ncbi:MAG: NAD-dependent epimerase/dehydratase family protein [Acidobacteriota bacterium]
MIQSDSRVFLVTGALGCIGAWVVYHLVKQGERVVAFDISDRKHRLNFLLDPQEQVGIGFVRGDLSRFEDVVGSFQEGRVTHVIHLAALQVPFCRADPVAGAQVNVVGTVNVFEAARRSGIGHVVYASSIAVYGPASFYPPGPVKPDAPFLPKTIYGVYKEANEGTARIYWEEEGLSSTALRPHTVYGVGRDQGVTSDPTRAMLAAAAGRDFQINFCNRVQLQFVSDVARQFVEASRRRLEGALAFNLGGEVVGMPELIHLIQEIVPSARISHSDLCLPFPESFDDGPLAQNFERVYQTPLRDGVRHSIEAFRSYLAEGRPGLELS